MPVADFLRPDSNVTQTNFTGGFADIDESSASDTDKAYPNTANAACTLEVGLGNPAGVPTGGTTTVRYRLAKIDTTTGNVSGTATNPTATLHVYQGAVLIASDTARTLTGTWTAFSFTPDMSSVTDWNDLRFRLTQTTTVDNRGCAISWAELETVSYERFDLASGSFALSGGAMVAGGVTYADLAGGSFALAGGDIDLIDKTFKFGARSRRVGSLERRRAY